MPIFEFACLGCGREFEQLVRASSPAVCPSCQSKDLQKKFSVFATSGTSGHSHPATMAPGGCGTCGDPRGPGACSLN